MKLTKTETKALKEMARVNIVNDRFMPQTVLGLVACGLAERKTSVFSYSRRYFAITESGRAALKEMGE